jgi:alkanesulfonate monooxygenase SsuD/methylene tetrahydromethanopterin reductase-like flavin-dependent oxidoreductase (luciferase family)
MKIGISIPESLHSPDEFFAWVKRVDEGPYSTLSVLDRVVYANYDPLISLAAATALTRRVRLMTEVLLAPLRNATLLAKEAASIDALSKGRLTLGLGVGSRESDFVATGAPFKVRGKLFEKQLMQMKHIWSGQPWSDTVDPIGPRPVQQDGPELILGGSTPIALRRVARYANGVVSSLNDISYIERCFRLVEQGWQEEQRPGQPRLIAQLDVAFESKHVGTGLNNIRAYYGRSPVAELKASTLITTDQQLRDMLRAVEQIAADEAVLFTWSAEPEQIDRIADIIA